MMFSKAVLSRKLGQYAPGWLSDDQRRQILKQSERQVAVPSAGLCVNPDAKL